MTQLPDPSPQKKADLLRLMLLKDYGGMWIDANSYFVSSNLSWLDHPQRSKLIHNKLGEEPDVLLGAYSQGALRLVHDEQLNATVNVYPGLENWFLAAKPSTKFFQDWWNTLQELLRDGVDAMDARL